MKLTDQIFTLCQVIPSVRDVLAMPVMAAGNPYVVGGAARLDRPVRWVHVSDASDLTGLLQGGELVLTTGPVFAADRDQVTGYLRTLVDLGVVGLIVELGTRVSSLPAYVGALADELGLPVVALRERIRYVDVTEQVHRLIVADRYQELQFAQSTHETFTALNITRASPRDIVTKASEILDAPLVLEDLNRHVLAFCRASSPATTLLEGWAERSRRNVTVGRSGWLAVPVGLGNQQWGRLVLPTGAVDRGRARMVLERAAQSLQLQRMLAEDRDALLVQAAGGLLDDLVSGRVSDDAEAKARAGALGMTASACYAPLVIAVASEPSQDVLAQGAVYRHVLAAARQQVSAAGLTAIGSVRREGTVALIIGCRSEATVDRTLTAFCAGLQDRLGVRVAALDWAAGTCSAAAGLVAAAEGLDEAEHVAEVGLAMPGPQRLYRSRDVRLRGLFALLRADPHVQSFADTELGRLVDHDARTGESLVTVLRAYLDSGGSKSEAAAVTGLSRPTLYTRLATIERLLGVSLETAESRTSLHAALMILDRR